MPCKRPKVERNTNQNNASLELAKWLSETVNAAWESGELLEQVTPTTQELLKFWYQMPKYAVKMSPIGH